MLLEYLRKSTDVEIDAKYQNSVHIAGIYDEDVWNKDYNPRSCPIYIAGLRNFLLAGKEEYFEQLIALFTARRDVLREITTAFQYYILHCEGWTEGLFFRKLSLRSGLAEDEIKKIFDNEYREQRRLQGITNAEAEIARLHRERELLAI